MKKGRPKLSQKVSTPSIFDPAYEPQFYYWLSHLRRAPRALQEVAIPFINDILNQSKGDSKVSRTIQILRLATEGNQTKIRDNLQFFKRFMKMMGIEQCFIDVICSKTKQSSKKSAKRLLSYGQMYKDCPIINLVRPNYNLTQYFAKKQGQLDIGSRFSDLPKVQSPFYTEPRFVEKLKQYYHLKNNAKCNGNILLLQYEGHAMVGGRTYAVLNKNYFQIWQMSSAEFPFGFCGEQNEIDSSYSSEVENQSRKCKKQTFNLSHKFVGHQEKITCASFSTDQFYIITGSVDRTVKLWDLRLQSLISEYKSHTKTVWDVHFNPSGYYFLSGSGDGLMALWRTDHPTPLRLYLHHTDIYKVSFAKNPNYVISAGQDGMVKIWQTIDAQLKYKIKLANPVINFNLGYSGQYIITIETDGRVTIHDLKIGKITSTFYFYGAKNGDKYQNRLIIHDACFSEDERTIVCIAKNFIVIYQMSTLEKQKSKNLFSKTELLQNYQKRVQPRQVIKLGRQLLVNFCGFRDFRVLVIGATLIKK